MKLTVVLRRSPSICEAWDLDPEIGEDLYVAHVEAETLRKAIQVAQEEAFRRDQEDDQEDDEGKLEHHTPDDYEHILVFEGHITPVKYGWSI